MASPLGRLPSLGPTGLAIASIATVLLVHWLGVPLLDQIELRTYDLRFQSRGAVAPAPDVVLAVVDEKSLDELGRWPWTRTRIAQLIDALSRDGARVIAFDIGFLEPEGAAQDAALAQAIVRSPADVVLGYFFHMEEPGQTYRIDPDLLARRREELSMTALTVRYRGVAPEVAPFLDAYAPETNLTELSEAAEGAGFFTLVPDPDGVVRRTPLVIRDGEEVYPSLALASAWRALGHPQLVVEATPDRVAVRLGDLDVPVDRSGRLLIDFPGPAGTFPSFSIADFLAGRVDPSRIRDRIVLVGVTATAVFDLRATPFGPVTPGLEVQAATLDNLLTGRFVTRPGWANLVDQLAIVLLGGFIGLLLLRLHAVSGLVVAALLGVAYALFTRQVFVGAGAWIEATHPLLALATTYTAITVQAYLSEERQRRQITSMFGQYTSPAVIEQMRADPNKLKLGGEERVLTVLFCDMAGFTTIAERLTPTQTIELLSEFHARMTERIFACEGMLKEYVGDEVMAIFGAPVAQPDHAARACRAALAMRVARTQLSVEWAQRGYPPIRSRTGVNSGAMLVGNIGSRYRFSYGVVGDAVNLGSRLEGLNKFYGTEILIGEQTAAMLGDGFRLREVDSVRVLGKKLPVRIFELLGEAGETLDPRREKARRPLRHRPHRLSRTALRAEPRRVRGGARARARRRTQSDAGGTLPGVSGSAAGAGLGRCLLGDREIALRYRQGGLGSLRLLQSHMRVEPAAHDPVGARLVAVGEGAAFLEPRAASDRLAVDLHGHRLRRLAVRDQLAAGARDRRREAFTGDRVGRDRQRAVLEFERLARCHLRVGIEAVVHLSERGDPALLDLAALLHHDRSTHGLEHAPHDEIERTRLLLVLVDPRGLARAVARAERRHVVAHTRRGDERARRDHDRRVVLDEQRNVIGCLSAVRGDVVLDGRASLDRARDGVERGARGDRPSAAVRLALGRGIRGRGPGRRE